MNRHVWPAVMAAAGLILVGFAAFAASGLAGRSHTPLTPTAAPRQRKLVVPAIAPTSSVIATTTVPSWAVTPDGGDIRHRSPVEEPDHEVVQPPVREQEGDSSRATPSRRMRSATAASAVSAKDVSTDRPTKTRHAEVHDERKVSHDNGMGRAERVGRRQGTVRRSSADTAHRR